MTDEFYSVFFTCNLNSTVEEISLYDIQNSFPEPHSNLIVLREYCVNQNMYFSKPLNINEVPNPHANETGITKIDPSIQNNLDQNSTFDRIYSSNSVTAYLPTGN
jgi:hypothetical protein